MKAAVCLYVRDEERSIAEWIAFHRVLGFDGFLVYDNLSVDGTRAVLEQAAAHADVRIASWDRTDPDAQRSAYEDALRRHGAEFDWVLFIDVDEFFVPVRFDSVHDFVGSLPQSRAVGLNWAMFGSSGVEDYPEGLVIETFTRRAPDDFQANRHVKSLVRPECVIRVACPHVSEVDGGYTDSVGRPMRWLSSVRSAPQLEACRIQHYFTRSHAQWRDKIARGYRDIVRGAEQFSHFDRNEVVDETALRFAPEVRARLKAWGLERAG